MREAIRKLVEAEDAAKQCVSAAKQQSEEILASARSHAQARLDRARREARRDAEQLVQCACEQAEQDKRSILAQTAASLEQQLCIDQATFERAVEAIIRCIRGR